MLHPTGSMAEGKVCPGCPERGRQPASAFYRHRSRPDGLQPYCKVCHRARSMRDRLNGRHAEWNRQGERRLRDALFAAYGDRCACCGESERAFLTLDHVDGVPDEHRDPKARSGRKSSGAIIRLLRDAGWPPGYQILCFNCNAAKGLFGTCPHEAVRRAAGVA